MRRSRLREVPDDENCGIVLIIHLVADPKSLSEDRLTVSGVDYADMRRIRTELRDAWITVSEKLAFQVLYKHLMQSFVKEEEEESLLYSLCGVVEAHLPGASLFGGDTCPQDGVTRVELLSAPAAKVEPTAKVEPSVPAARVEPSAPAAKVEPTVQAAKMEPSWQAANVGPSLQAAKVEPSLQAAKVEPSLPAANVGHGIWPFGKDHPSNSRRARELAE